MLTVILTSIVIYLYTVLAFNFFRKFYVKDNEGVKDAKCHDMLTVSEVKFLSLFASFFAFCFWWLFKDSYITVFSAESVNIETRVHSYLKTKNVGVSWFPISPWLEVLNLITCTHVRTILSIRQHSCWAVDNIRYYNAVSLLTLLIIIIIFFSN